MLLGQLPCKAFIIFISVEVVQGLLGCLVSMKHWLNGEYVKKIHTIQLEIFLKLKQISRRFKVGTTCIIFIFMRDAIEAEKKSSLSSLRGFKNNLLLL